MASSYGLMVGNTTAVGTKAANMASPPTPKAMAKLEKAFGKMAKEKVTGSKYM